MSGHMSIPTPSSLPARELEFVDDDIRAMFADEPGGTPYFIGTPLMAQLVKELRLLRAVLEKKTPTLD